MKTKTTHTPGPWYVSRDDAHDCPPHKDSGLAMIDTGRTNDWPIARLMEWNNVHLVAAAPALLEACEAALVACENAWMDSEDAPLSKKLRAAIAKAQGMP